ncbi:hypothetical protein NM688_g7647 [Phlebia brevispora]|uniref:Uncharacterized protein n=1 Tax=Phlebia brevispora TaxID=194682 RepID=A0ACC1S2T8_9APHY|nr:hypothetical protein NM688_g7647 [Phlebia brevispora]
MAASRVTGGRGTEGLGRFYVVLGGGGRAGVCNAESVPVGRHVYAEPTLPVIVKCCTESEALQMHTRIGSIFLQFEAQQLTPHQMAARIFYSEAIAKFFDGGRSCKVFIPLFFGNDGFACIYLTQEDFAAAKTGASFAKHTRLTQFAEALA